MGDAMSVTFQPGYRAICWFYIEMFGSDWRRLFSETVFSLLNEKKPYLGVSFGKFSRVVDFHDRSAKVASHHIAMLSESLAQKDFRFSPSMLLCKPLTEQKPEKTGEFKIRTYTFFKPRSKDGILPAAGEILKLIQENTAIPHSVYAEAFWNNSCFPLMMVLHGNNYGNIAECVRQSRLKSSWVADSSTFVTLKIDPTSHNVVEDEKLETLPAMIFSKMYSFPEIGHLQLRTASSRPLLPHPKEVFGWHDICDILAFNSLYDLHNHIVKMKTDSEGKIARTSTILFNTRNEQ